MLASGVQLDVGSRTRAILRAEHIKIEGLSPLSFQVGGGECLALEAPSGAGKTRLLRALADLDPSTGRVFVDGAERSEMPATAWRAMVRYVSAEPAWWTGTARDALPAKKDQQTRAVRIVGALGLTPADLDKDLATLSTGQRHRLALARSLVDDPRVLLLDEPTTGLDPASAALVEELIRYRLLSGSIVILASHDAALRQRLARARLQIGKRPPPQQSAFRAQP